MPKILFVTQYHYLRYTGGAELQCWMLAREFARRGWDVHYVSENNRPDAPRELDSIRLHYLPELPHWRDGNRRQLADVFEKVQPDVVYNRVFNLYTHHAMTLAPREAVTVWASAFVHDGSVTATLPELWATKSLKQFLVLVHRTLTIRARARRAALAAKIQLAQSNEQIEILRSRDFAPVLLRNSFEFPADMQVQTHDGKPLVLWVGGVKQRKRPELFYELARRCQDIDCEFVMAGELQDEQSKQPLAAAQRELKNFRYAGFVPADIVGKLYERAHVFVSTSQSEGFPNTFIQAWQRGVPVLSLDIDPDGLLSDEGMGVLVQNMNDMESQLRGMLADPQRRRVMGQRAHDVARREFNLEANVNRLEEMIRAKMRS